MNSLKIFLTSLLMLCLCSVWGQTTAALKKQGDEYFQKQNWWLAAQRFEAYQQQAPGNLDVLTRLGICYYHLHQPQKALQTFLFVLQAKPGITDPDLYYYLARTYHGLEEWQRAIVSYKNFLRIAPAKHPLRAHVVDNIKRCVSGMSIEENPEIALIENFGERVNSEGDEFAPVPSVNHAHRIYFSTARPTCEGGLRDDQGLTDPVGGRWRADMYFTNLTGGGWDFPQSLGSLLNTAREEVVLDFNEKGQVLFYFRGFTRYAGQMFADTASANDEYSINPPVFPCPFEPESGDQSPYFFNDSTLIFASRRPGGWGGLDLWLTCKSKSGRWSAPQNLGDKINSAYDETSPYLAPNGRTLFFSSNRLQSMGGLDVFTSVFDDAKMTWTTPKNMGMGINSPGDDAYFRLSRDGKVAYFSSDRLESLGMRDLYIAYFREEQTAALTPSQPTLFTDVGKVFVENPTSITANTSTEITLPPIFYENDKDLNGAVNQKIIQQVADAIRPFPLVQLVVTAHTHEDGPAKFDLYNGIKRAEIVGKTLLAAGIPAERVVLFSVGSAFPMATNVLGTDENPIGQKLNRRVDFSAVQIEGKSPVQLKIDYPKVAEIMQVGGADELSKKSAGLTFRVQVASMRQLLNDDALSMFEDVQIETQPGSGEYRYLVGYCKKMVDARALRNELIEQGFSQATIRPFIDGVPISRSRAVSLAKKYPELANFIKD